jgi:SAM-dependent methyltransferase
LRGVRESLLPRIRCPACRADGAFELETGDSDEREVRSGALRCGRCGHEARIERGVVDLLHEPPESVRREAAGLERFAGVMRADGWDRERILNLPNDELEYWRGQARQLERMLDRVDLRPGQSLLDVGSNTCWASNAFAELGLDVIALDISTAEMQGLYTADWWMEANGVHFERVLSTMAEPAIASDSLDWVFCCEVLHHNPPSDLDRTLAELWRVLRPGGALLVLNEPLRYPTNLKREHGAEVAQFEGNENVYFFHEYRRAARRAGFEVEVVEPSTPVFTGEPLWLVRESSALGSTKVYAQQLLRRTRAGRRALLWWSLRLGPDGNVSMICRKPAAA